MVITLSTKPGRVMIVVTLATKATVATLSTFAAHTHTYTHTDHG